MIYDGHLGVDRNERILTSVIRERGQHRRVPGVEPGWVVLGAVLVVVVLTVGFQLAARQRAALESSGMGSGGVDASATVGPAPLPLGEQARESAAPAVSTPGPRVATVEPRRVPSAGGPLTRYTVQPGDSLQMIASRNHLSPATLVSLNELEDPDILQPGRELLIPSTDGFVHVVEPGETLRAIADRYGSQTAALIDANGLSTPDNITVGLRLFIPRDNSVAGATPTR
jgi:LysM repeat protein